MDIKRFTFILGLVFVLVGILGFVPQLVDHHPMLGIDPDLSNEHGLLFGLFPVNGVHNVVHILFGVWALWASQNVFRSRTYCRANAVLYGGLAILGFFPGFKTMFGLMPIHGHDIWLHGAIAMATGYYGYIKHGQRDPRLHRQT
jgi:hypothetical protein